MMIKPNKDIEYQENQERPISGGSRNAISLKTRFQDLIEEIKNITTLNLAFNGGNILEKVFWITIFIIGTVWAIYFIGKKSKNLFC